MAVFLRVILLPRMEAFPVEVHHSSVRMSTPSNPQRPLPHKLLRDCFAEIRDAIYHSVRGHGSRTGVRSQYLRICEEIVEQASLTYKLICYVLREEKPEGDNTPLVRSLASQLYPTARHLLELHATFVALSIDPDAQMRKFLASAIRDEARYTEFFERYRNETNWVRLFEQIGAMREDLFKDLGISPADSPSYRPFKWPASSGLTPGTRRHLGAFPPDAIAMLDYMELRYYREYSTAGHVTYRGLVAASVWRDDAQDRKLEDLRMWEHRVILGTSVIHGALLAEMVAHFKLALTIAKAREMWTYLQELSTDAKDLWKIRYDALLK